METEHELLEAVRVALPPGVTWAPILLWSACFALLTAGAARLVRYWAARPFWRAAEDPRDLHWTERARLRAPIGAAVIYASLVFPTLSAFLGGIAWGPLHALGLRAHVTICALSAAVMCIVLGFVSALRDPIFDFTLPEIVRGWVVNWVLLRGVILILAVTALAMPTVLGWGAVVVFALGVATTLWLMSTGAGPFLRLCGALVDADERVCRIVAERAEHHGIRVPHVAVLRVPMANAFAFALARRVFVTERAVSALDDDELGAILDHEIGHLTESAAMRSVRVARAVALLLLAWAVPLYSTYGLGIALLPGLVGFVFLWITHRRMRAMEERADGEAHEGHGHGPALARALERLYRLNESPVHTESKSDTHPPLFDRMLAAGVTPDYPRPDAPDTKRAMWGGMFCALLFGFVGIGLLFSLPGPLVSGSDATAAERRVAFAGGKDPWPLRELAIAWEREGRTAEARSARRLAGLVAERPWEITTSVYELIAAGDLTGAHSVAEQRGRSFGEDWNYKTSAQDWLATEWAWIWTMLQDDTLAQRWLSVAIQNSGGHPDLGLEVRLGRVAIRLGNREAAQVHANVADSLLPDQADPWTLARLGFLFQAIGNEVDAARCFDRARNRARTIDGVESGDAAESLEAYLGEGRRDPLGIR